MVLIFPPLAVCKCSEVSASSHMQLFFLAQILIFQHRFCSNSLSFMKD